MNMASMGILLIFTVIFISTGNAESAFIKVECKSETVGQYGQHSLLECVIKTQNDAEIRVVTWKKKGADRPSLVFNKGKTTPQPGCSFAEPSWNVKNMNVSLLITNTALEHEGGYECMVLTDSGEGRNDTSLKVAAKYSKPTIHSDRKKSPPNTDFTLMCESVDGYPQGELRWFKDHDTEPTRAKVEVKQTESGLYRLSSKLLVRASTASKYTCMVFNASGGKEEETSFETQEPPKTEEQGQRKELDPATKIVAPVVVIGSLIAGLLMALLIYRRRSQRARRHSTAPLISQDHQAVCTSVDGEGDFQDKTCDITLA